MKNYELAFLGAIIIIVVLAIVSRNPLFLGIALLISSILWILDSALSGIIDPIEDNAHESLISDKE